MTYPELLDVIGSSYKGFEVMDAATDGAAIGKFILQYEETDWQFLKRLASRMHTGLMPAAVFDHPKFYFGVFESHSKGKLVDYNYQIKKRLSAFRYSTENEAANVVENDFIYYEVETDRVLDLGNGIEFKGKLLYVCEAHTKLANGQLKHLYILSSKRGLRQKKLYNEQIIGASLQGEVIGVSKDTVKVHLSIDDSQSKSGAHSFPYASVYTAEGNSGWYCMPEIGDHVRIYFPGNKEEEGVASSSVRLNSEEGETNKFSNPDIKYFRTPSGKEIKLSPDEIVITAKDGDTYIKLNDASGIEIMSSKSIKLVTKEDIVMDAGKKLNLVAKEEINLTCKESSIKLDGSTTITGLEVKTN